MKFANNVDDNTPPNGTPIIKSHQVDAFTTVLDGPKLPTKPVQYGYVKRPQEAKL